MSDRKHTFSVSIEIDSEYVEGSPFVISKVFWNGEGRDESVATFVTLVKRLERSDRCLWGMSWDELVVEDLNEPSDQ